MNRHPRGAFRDLGEALRLINGVRTGYDLDRTEVERLTELAVDLRRITQDIFARTVLERAGTDETPPKPGTTIEYDDTAGVYEAWGLPSPDVRSYLGSFVNRADADAACRRYVEEGA